MKRKRRMGICNTKIGISGPKLEMPIVYPVSPMSVVEEVTAPQTLYGLCKIDEFKKRLEGFNTLRVNFWTSSPVTGESIGTILTDMIEYWIPFINKLDANDLALKLCVKFNVVQHLLERELLREDPEMYEVQQRFATKFFLLLHGVCVSRNLATESKLPEISQSLLLDDAFLSAVGCNALVTMTSDFRIAFFRKEVRLKTGTIALLPDPEYLPELHRFEANMFNIAFECSNIIYNLSL